jgi:Txe/YoeB family toxin of Txe-Axe toxin-antitoxin module
MNSDVMPSRVKMEANHLKQLVEEVKETVATGIQTPENLKPSSFGVVDLWNIQKTGRYATHLLRRRVI